MSLLKQWVGVTKYMVSDSDTFVEQYDEDHGISYPIQFLAITAVAMALPLTLLMVLANPTSPEDLKAAAIIGVAAVIIGFVAAVAEALLLHGIVTLLGGRNGAVSTFEAYAFPSAIRYTLALIPPLNLIFGAYGLYLQIKTLASFQDISTGRSAVALIVAPLIVVPISLVALGVLLMFVLELGSAPA